MSWQASTHIRGFTNAIVHIDGDAFFASCEQAVHPEYKNKPVITGKERGIISSLSYEAKSLGVKRGMRVFEAKKVCQSLIVLPSDYETYSLFSKRMFAIMKRFTSLVEEYSIDEGFADLTGLRRPMKMNYQTMAKKMKESIDRELGFTVSVGLASSKSLAKLASKWKKPNGFTFIEGRDIKNYLKHLEVDDLWGVGSNTAHYMNKLGIKTALDFINKPFEWVRQKFTKPHREMWRELNGEMVNPVICEEKTSYASISKTKTFTPASKNKDFIYSQLVKNIENACIKLRRHGLVAKKMGIFIKTQNFRYLAVEAEISRPTAYPNEINHLVETLFEYVFKTNLEYRATGVVFSEIQENKNIQKTLFEPPLRLGNQRRIYDAIDELAHRFGKHTVYSGASYKANKYGAHENERGDQPARKNIALKGETKRQRLNIPLLDIKIK